MLIFFWCILSFIIPSFLNFLPLLIIYKKSNSPKFKIDFKIFDFWYKNTFIKFFSIFRNIMPIFMHWCMLSFERISNCLKFFLLLGSRFWLRLRTHFFLQLEDSEEEGSCRFRLRECFGVAIQLYFFFGHSA